MRKRAFAVELMPIDRVKYAEYNPRVFDLKRYELIKESLSKLGWLIPAYVSAGELLSGHQRAKAWQELGESSIPFELLGFKWVAVHQVYPFEGDYDSDCCKQ